MGFKNEHVHGKKDVARINERKARGRVMTVLEQMNDDSDTAREEPFPMPK
jgi:hypothetical protein